MEQLLTVIVPVYNVEKYLKECVESLVNQTYRNMEIILVDDGSRDSSPMLCDEFQKKYANVKVIHQVNGGLPVARNAGIHIARGKYIAFIDSDDVIDKDMYASLIKNMEDSNSQISICNKKTFDKRGIIGIADSYKNAEISDMDIIEFYQCALDSCCNRVFLLDIIKDHDIKFESKDVVAQEDFFFQIKYFTYINKIHTTSVSYYYYRQRKSSITKSKNNYLGYCEKCIRFIELAEEYVKQNSNRKIEEFLQTQLLVMLFSSISNIPEVTSSKVKKTIMLYKKSDKYKDSLKSKAIGVLYDRGGLRSSYFKTLILLLRINFIEVVSLLETIRVKRLRDTGRTESFYE